MSSLEIRSFEKSDHAEWRRLWTAYLEFYEFDSSGRGL